MNQSTLTAPLTVLYHDDYLVAIDKPSGILVHRTRLSQDRRFVLQMLRDQLGRRVFPVHRLDRATSGVLVFAFSSEATGRLAGEFSSQRVAKHYLALARGWTAQHAQIDYALRDEESSGALQPAVTRFRRLATVELPVAVDRYPTARYSLLDVVPMTGRRQQIRKHLKHISHHLIGDTTHGNGRHNRFFRELLGTSRLWLHARSIQFRHPYTGQEVLLRAPLDADWQRLLQLFQTSLPSLFDDV